MAHGSSTNRVGEIGATGQAERHPCPCCGSSPTRRSPRRNWAERMLGIIALPYRCDKCGRRFYRWRQRKTLQQNGLNEDIGRHQSCPIRSVAEQIESTDTKTDGMGHERCTSIASCITTTEHRLQALKDRVDRLSLERAKKLSQRDDFPRRRETPVSRQPNNLIDRPEITGRLWPDTRLSAERDPGPDELAGQT